MRDIAVVIGLLALALGACGGGEKEAVAAVFQRLDDAQRRGDAEEACEKVFVVREASAAEGEGEDAELEADREGGGSGESPQACRAAFEAGQAARRDQVRSLRTSVESVQVDGDRATAKVRATVTRSDGSKFSNVSERELLRADGGWRIRISPEG